MLNLIDALKVDIIIGIYDPWKTKFRDEAFKKSSVERDGTTPMCTTLVTMDTKIHAYDLAYLTTWWKLHFTLNALVKLY